MGGALLTGDQAEGCESQVGNSLESCQVDAYETYGGEVLDRTHLLFILMQGDGELVPYCMLGLTIAGMNIRLPNVGDEVTAHPERIGMYSDTVLEEMLMLVQLVILVDVLGIGC